MNMISDGLIQITLIARFCIYSMHQNQSKQLKSGAKGVKLDSTKSKQIDIIHSGQKYCALNTKDKYCCEMISTKYI